MSERNKSDAEVERLAQRLIDDAGANDAARYQPYTDGMMRNAAFTLRALLAERRTHRAALEDIAWAKDDGRPGPDLRSCIILARAALAQEPPQ